MGGIDEYYNLIYLCESCHHKMHNMINEKFYRTQEKDTIIKDLMNYGISVPLGVEILHLPASRMMEGIISLKMIYPKK